MVIANQGVAIQLCFQQSKHMQFYKTGQLGCVYKKTGTKHASKGGIDLAVFKALPGSPDRGTVLRFGVAVQVLVHLLAVLLVDRFSLVHTVIYDTYKPTHNQEKEIKVLSPSSNRK